MKYKVKPTSKQSKAVEYLDNHGGSVGAAMIAVGYSKATAKNPSKLTKSRALQSIAQANGVTIEQYMRNIGEAMKANKVASIAGDFYQTEIPDHLVRLAGNKQAREFLELEEEKVNPDLTKAISDNVDEIELQRLIFKKS